MSAPLSWGLDFFIFYFLNRNQAQAPQTLFIQILTLQCKSILSTILEHYRHFLKLGNQTSGWLRLCFTEKKKKKQPKKRASGTHVYNFLPWLWLFPWFFWCSTWWTSFLSETFWVFLLTLIAQPSMWSKLSASVVSMRLIFTGQDDKMKAAAANNQSNDSAWDRRVERGELELCIALSDYVFLKRKQTSNWAQENIRPLIIPQKRALLYRRKWGLSGVCGFGEGAAENANRLDANFKLGILNK